MSIKKRFGGATIRKPGAYSQSQTSPDAGSPTISTDTIFLVGESDAGAGGAEEGIQMFSASALNRLIAKYRSGPIVDAAKVVLQPSRTPGINGAGRIAVYKTNPSSQAELALATSYGDLLAQEYGAGGNRLTARITLSAEALPKVTGSAAVTDFAGLDTLTLQVRLNGGSSQSVTFAAPANIADVLSQINTQTTGLMATAAGAILSLETDARTNGHRDGWSQSIEVIGGSALTRLFLTAGQFGTPASEQEASILLTQPRDSKTEADTVGGEVALQIGRDNSDSATAATVQITSTSIELVATGSDSYSFLKSEYPLLKDLKAAIQASAGWTITMSSTLNSQPTSSLDQVSAIGAFSEAGNKPARIKRDAAEVAAFFEASSLMSLDQTAAKGLPDALATTNLAGGAKGASASSSFDAGFAAALGQEVNAIVPLVSQDAAQDITAGFTDPASTYDIETVHAALDAALRLRGNIKNRKEAQGAVGYRKEAMADVFAQAASLGSELIQLYMQDVLVIDSSNELTWKQPHILAAMVSAARLGTEVGTPMTHKYMAVQGAGHFVNASTGKSDGDFDALIDYDDAIDAGVTALEPASGSFRVMIDNTTYGADENFVFNRGSVMQASQYIARTVRTDAELAFVGKKNAIVDATAIKSRIRTKLVELFEDKITSPSDDAPQGYREDTFIVTVQGNTAEVQVEVKPVQGLDFVFITFTLGDTTQSA